MKRIVWPAILMVAALAAPAAADTAEDLEICDDSDQPAEERLAACTRLIEAGDQAPEDLSWIYYARGDVHFTADNYEAALADFTAVTEVDPESADGYRALGATYLSMDRHEEAIAELNRAEERDPDDYWAVYLRANTYRDMGDLDRAFVDYAAALEVRPNSTAVLASRARLFERLDRYEEALADYTHIIDVAPYDAETYAARGRLHEDMGNAAEVVRDLRVAQLLNPNLGTPEFILPDYAPTAAVEAPGPLAFAAPEVGMHIRYLQVMNELQPEVDPMEEAIMGLVAFFAGPNHPLPIDRDTVDRLIGETVDAETSVVANAVFVSNQEAFEVSYVYGLLPGASPGTADTPPMSFSYDGLEAIWGLGEGESASGTGGMELTCPPEVNIATMMIGCLTGVASVPIGDLAWTATFEGWEYVVVPAGYRLAARFSYSDTTTATILGRTVEGGGSAVLWYDPEINWWIRRERTEGDRVQTVEAWTIDLP